ncbi:DUF4307 domain-containing protein [Brachybacterium sp. EF45031]|uniref:DUF4307 domain-containing protein n=1 Tax=Brachybacterium sillae TaxID=2810536 RepID=UPI00217D5C17|nr:DUF4307 domain-containing protein [Brachybacterium sillae]MCS6711181.1 DUF4307 domain-containing protein [Brachybacterium sillae]
MHRPSVDRPTDQPSPEAEDLSDRYGRPLVTPRLSRLLMGLGALALVALVIAIGVRFADPGVRYETVAYEHRSPTSIQLTFSVTMPTGRTARCTVEAFDDRRAQVGFTEVEIPAQSSAVSVHRVEITTQGDAVAAAVKDCRAV